MHRGCCRLLQGLGKLCCFLLAAVQRAEGCQHLWLARALLAECWEEQAVVPRGVIDKLCHPLQLRCWPMLLAVMVGLSLSEWTVKNCNKIHCFPPQKKLFPSHTSKLLFCYSAMFAVPSFLFSETPQRLVLKIWQDNNWSHQGGIVCLSPSVLL